MNFKCEKNVRFRTLIAHCIQWVIEKESLPLFRINRFMEQKILIADDNDDIPFMLKKI